jgi:tRNA(His) guanylyltransferase
VNADEENTPLDTRMKAYEHTFRQYLPRRAYTLMRLDGRAFHTYLRGVDKPFDMPFVYDMDAVAMALCMEIQGVRFAYTQSDEISLLLTDFDTTQSEPWVKGNVAKLTSLSAGFASAMLATLRLNYDGVPTFDCRVWSMSDPVEVANYFVWRQRDAVRNSVQMAGQAYFSQAELHGKSGNEVQEMLFQQHGVNWNDYPAGCKRGRLVFYDGPSWVMGTPTFKAEPGNALARLIPPLPSLWDDTEAEKEKGEQA